MKTLITTGVAMFAFKAALADIPKHSLTYYEAVKPEVQEAQRKGAKAKLSYKIVDDEGTPITNAMVYGQWQNDYPRKTWKETFVTDANGEFIAKGKVGGRFGFYVKKDGCYLSSTGVEFHWRHGVFPLVKDGKWQPYGECRTLVVKRKKMPIDMPMLLDTAISVPATNVWLGLDLETFKLTSPYGDGAHADMQLCFNSEPVNKYVPNWATMEVSFTNNPHGGFYVLPKDEFSELKSSYNANINMLYRTTRTFRIGRMASERDILNDDSYIVFRTRTKVDDKGRLVSAHYGKIYGPWYIWRNTRARMIFFNTIPNDTNLEDMETFKNSEMTSGR